MRNRRFTVILMCLLLLQTWSCDDSYSVFSNRYHVFYRCDASQPPFNAACSMGVFISVRQSGQNLVVTDMDGHESRYPMSEVDARSFHFGLAGIVIGTPALDNPDCAVYAFDLGCPVCDRSSKRIVLNSAGVAECPDCHTTFDLNNNGFVLASERSDARPLYRYPVSRSGSQIVVSN